MRKVIQTVRKIKQFLSNELNEIIAYCLLILLGRKNNKLLKRNRIYKNKHKGERCFIIGNGPSINKQNLSLLSEEYVFTVNQMIRDERFDLLKSNYHIIADPLYFNLDINNPYHKKVLNLIEKAVNSETKCFFPIQSRCFIEKLNISTDSVYYFFAGCKMYENYYRKIDYSKSVPGFYNVVQFAITLAIYMGFSEIYLLGCDMTGYKEIEEKAFGNYEDKHCYHLSEEEKRNVLHNDRTCEEYFNGFAHMFTDYRRLEEYTAKRGIKLVNLTEGGVLDSLPREKYESVIR